MVQEQSYKHITVTADDDDEIVIHTGASRKRSREEETELVYEDEESADQHLVSEEAEDSDEELEEWSGDALEDEAERGASEQETADVPSTAARTPQYRETTQEDLDSVGPRTTTQKAVIGCVVVFLIAFVIYYIFIMERFQA